MKRIGILFVTLMGCAAQPVEEEYNPVGEWRVELDGLETPGDCGLHGKTSLDFIVGEDFTVRHRISATLLTGTVYHDGYAVDVYAPGGSATATELLHVQLIEGEATATLSRYTGGRVCVQTFEAKAFRLVTI